MVIHESGIHDRMTPFKRSICFGVTSALVAVAVLAVSAPAGAAVPPEIPSPLGQVQVVSVNAKQARVLDVERFERLLALTLAIRNRPPAFNGGLAGALTAPDVVIVQEMSFSNAEILRRLMNQRSDSKYEIVTTENSKPKILYDSNTVGLNGEPVPWVDPCLPANGDDPGRQYLFARFVESTSQLPFTVAGIHLNRKYDQAGQKQCREKNVAELRAQLAGESGPVIVGGDFNQRSTDQPRECDPEEQGDPSPWYAALTAPTAEGTVYVDAVRDWHRRHGQSLEDEWTHERRNEKMTCEGVFRLRRSRIDYLFAARAAVAEAHADHPGWAGPEPGTRDPANGQYSDHRFVWGRFVIGGPPQPETFTSETTSDGVVHLSWGPSEGAALYIVYRARQGYAYSELVELDGAVTTYDDVSTKNGRTYVYAVAPVDQNGLQGLESQAVAVTVDTVGPKVVDVDPNRGATSVPRDAAIHVRFNEPTDPLSVTNATIRLTRNGIRTRGVLEQISDEELSFISNELLKKDAFYTITVRPVTDLVGNAGRSFTSTFRTASE
jgi:endonuclease/exonuclease/phosphatase family metal-dependent hydrolase